MFLRQDPNALGVLTEAVSDHQQYLAGVCYQQDTPVVAALCPVLLFVGYHDDDIFSLLLRHLSPPLPIQTTISSSLRGRAGSPLRVVLDSSRQTPPDPTAFPFANERVASVSEFLAAFSRAIGQGLQRCSGRASVTLTHRFNHHNNQT